MIIYRRALRGCKNRVLCHQRKNARPKPIRVRREAKSTSANPASSPDISSQSTANGTGVAEDENGSEEDENGSEKDENRPEEDVNGSEDDEDETAGGLDFDRIFESNLDLHVGDHWGVKNRTDYYVVITATDPLMVQYYKQNRGKISDNYYTLFPQKEEFDMEELGMKVPQPKMTKNGRRIFYNFE